MAEDTDANVVKSNATLDLERRLEGDTPNKFDTLRPGVTETGEARSFATEDTDDSGYIGVDPVYMTHANDTEKPLAADGGVEAKLEEMNTDRDENGIVVTVGAVGTESTKKKESTKVEPTEPEEPEEKPSPTPTQPAPGQGTPPVVSGGPTPSTNQ